MAQHKFENTGKGYVLPWVKGRSWSVDGGSVRWFNEDTKIFEYALVPLNLEMKKLCITEASGNDFRYWITISMDRHLQRIGFNFDLDCYLIIYDSDPDLQLNPHDQ
jgi:hypothetical protein